MKLNDFFENIYVISLLNATERRDSIYRLSKKYDFNFQYIDAVDKSTINLEKFKDEKKWAYPGNNFYCSKRCSCNGLGHELNTSQVGCQLSHEIAWRDIIRNKYKNALIMEDDISFHIDFENLFTNITSEISKNWNFLYLGKLKKIESNQNIIKIKHGFSGTHMYGLSMKAAEKAVNNLYPLRAAADGYLNRFLIQRKFDSAKLKNCYASVENLGFNDSIDGKTDSYIDGKLT
jgi:GR25 family glycosyltransferase involved in LPS biosynthesis